MASGREGPCGGRLKMGSRSASREPGMPDRRAAIGAGNRLPEEPPLTMDERGGHAILAQHFPVLADWFVDLVLKLSAQPEPDRHQLLLAAHDLGVESYGLRRELQRIGYLVDPVETQRPHIIASCLRQVVLTTYGLAPDERRRWLKYWLDERNISGENMVTASYIVNLAAENLDLLSQSSREYAATWYIRHKNLKAPRSRAWGSRTLALCGRAELARERAVQMLSERAANGSWEGGYPTTAAITYALLRSGVVAPEELVETVGYLVRRLQRGLTGNVALESTTLKLLKIAGLLTQRQEMSLLRGVGRDRSVFLSHSSQDKSFVRRLGKALADTGIRVWVDQAEIRGGDSFVDKIEEGLADMQYLVVVLSPSSTNSYWVKRELNYALVAKVETQQGKVIPVLLETCEIPPLLGDRHYIDFREDFRSGLRELLRAIDVGA